MKTKKIPVIMKGRTVQHISEDGPVISRVYEKWWKILLIKKIYHVRGVKVVIESEVTRPYELKA